MSDDATIDELKQANAALQQQVNHLQQQLAWLKKQMFGRKSEKRRPEVPPEQLTLEGMAPPQPKETETTVTVTYRRGTGKKDRQGAVTDEGLRFDGNVPIVEIRRFPKALEGLSPEEYEIIDEKVTHRLGQLPGDQVILRYVTPVIKRKADQSLHQAPAVPNIIDKSQLDVSFIAGMMTDKLNYHLPLHRIHQRLSQNGITVSRGSLTQNFHKAVQLLIPVYDAQRENILRSKTLAMDETPVKAGRTKPGKMRQAYYWVLYGEQDEVAFVYAPTRATEHVEAILQSYHGTLISDGYAAYTRYASHEQNLIHAQCWAHARRKFTDAEASHPQQVATALDYIRHLYRIEKTIKENRLTGEAKQRHRAQNSKPVVEAFFQWLEDEQYRQGLTPSDAFVKATQYVLQRRDGLTVFLENPEVPLDTNHLERALRAIPMGRKNWLFNWTEIGAEYVGVIQSLMTTCRLHGVNPYHYLVDVLQRVDRHPANRVDELIPRNWKNLYADNPLRSDVMRVWDSYRNN